MAAVLKVVVIPEGIKRLSELFCGCCTIENTWDKVFVELIRCEKAEYCSEDGVVQAVCNHFGLTEHGTSIRGSWLTKRGEEALAFLRQHSTSWTHCSADEIEFIDDEDTRHN